MPCKLVLELMSGGGAPHLGAAIISEIPVFLVAVLVGKHGGKLRKKIKREREQLNNRNMAVVVV